MNNSLETSKSLISIINKVLCPGIAISPPDHLPDAINVNPNTLKQGRSQDRIFRIEEGVEKLDPVGSTVRYEMMKLCTRSIEDTMRR